MKSTVKKLPESKVELEVEIPSEEFNHFVERATLSVGKDLEVEGFRKGKAPKEVVEQKVGKENILVEAADLAIKENYAKAVLENKIEAISQPEIDILKLAAGNPLIFRAKTSVLPEIKLGDYKEIAKKVEKKEVSVEDKEIDNALKWFQKSRAKLTLKNGAIEKGDYVEVEYWSPQIKELSQTETKKDSFILGEGHFISGFEDNLIGMEAKEKEKEFSLILPENYAVKELAGKKVDFKVKVKSVQKVEPPEINDDFAKSLGKFENLEGFRNNIKEGLTSEKKQAESQRVRNEILDKISQDTGFEVPKVLIEREQKVMMDNFKQEVSEKLNTPLKDYLDKIKKTEQEIFNSFSEEAKKKVRNFLILREIGKRENIEVSDEEVREEMNKILKHYSVSEKTEKDIDIERLKEYSRGVLKNEKIFALLEI